MKVFEVKDLTFKIKNKYILKHITFSVKHGEWLLIAGPNGAGKSTLVKIASRVLRDFEGNILIWGKDIQTYSHKQLSRKMATLFSTFSPLYNIKAYDYVRLGVFSKTGFLSYYRGKNMQDVNFAIETTEIEGLLNKGILELSQGELQRVRIAKILAQNPQILLLDEPLSHLDIKHKIWILDLLARLRATGKTIISVVHDFTIAFPYPDRFLLIKEGKNICEGERKHDDKLTKAFSEVFDLRFSIKDGFLLPSPEKT